MSNLLDVLNQKPFSSMDTIDLNSSHIITKLTKDSIHCEINQSKPLQPPFTNCAHQTPENRRFRETTERITIQIIAGHPQQEKSTKNPFSLPKSLRLNLRSIRRFHGTASSFMLTSSPHHQPYITEARNLQGEL